MAFDRSFLPLVALLSTAAVTTARAELLDLSGSLDVSAVQTDIGGREEDTLRQQYVIGAWRRLSEYFDVRASLRYFSFDVDSPSDLGLFREEVQPSGEVSWRHPWFHLNSSARRRVATSLVSDGDLINESFSLDWRTVRQGIPVFSLRYDAQNTEDTSVDVDQELEDRRFQAGVDIERPNENIGYLFSARTNENVVRGLRGDELAHQFRYLGSYRPGDADRWRVLTQYYYNRRDRTDEVLSGETFLEQVPVERGLFEIDTSPDQGELGSAPGLIDGNTLVAAAPTIDVGAGAVDRNLGADLGLSRGAVAAVFVYTDRLAGAGTSWFVYVSDDGTNWSLHTAAPRAEYFTVQQRFEIRFEPVSTRYVKVVNGGANAVTDVLVTEIQVFEELPAEDEIDRDASSHIASTQVNWQVLETLALLVDTSGRLEPGQGTVEDRKSVDYAVRLDWRPSRTVRHSTRAQQAWQFFSGQDETIRDDQVAYSFFYDPLSTLSASTTASLRQTTIGEVRDQELLTWLGEVDARPLPSTYFVVEGLLSRLDQPASSLRSDSWQLRASTDLDVTGNLSVLVSWLHRETETSPTRDLRVRRNWSANVSLQVTPALFARAGLTWLDDLGFSRRQDYVVSWLLGTRLTASGQVIFEDTGQGTSVDRHALNLSLDLTPRATVYVTYSRLDQRTADGDLTESWQQGLRMSF